jgi:CDP-glucose 4,6-dehydratase
MLTMLDIADQVHIVRGDIVNYSDVERAINEYDAKTVFHLAAQALVGIANRSPLSTFESNIKGSWNVLEAARVIDTVEETIVASSDKAYGDQPVLPYTEDASMNGLHPYDASKSCTDILARTYAHTWNMPVTVTRCGNLYGGGDLNWNRIVPDTIQALVRQQSPQIRSDGKFMRDYLYVEDAAEAYMCLAEQTAREDVRGRAFNFGLGRPVPVLEVVNELCEIHGERIEPTILNQAAGEIRDQYLDCNLAKEVLGWEPRHDLTAGLTKAYEWYTDYLDRQKLNTAA